MSATAGGAPPTASPNLNEVAHRAIRGAIIRCELPPGYEVSEKDLMHRFGLGRAPVRASLIRLAQEGLVDSMPRRGHQVAPITLRFVRDTFDLRVLLECEAARRATGTSSIEALRRLNNSCVHAFDPRDTSSVTTYLAANTRFHVGVANASGNERLARLLSQVLDDMERIFYLVLTIGQPSLSLIHGHDRILSALATERPTVASRLVAQQLRHGQEAIEESLRAHSNLMYTNLGLAPTSRPQGAEN